MNKNTGKSLELAKDRFLARDRMPIFLGSDMPQTIAMKEIIDNEIDIVSEKGQKADKAIIYMSPSRLKVMDNGTGISADDDINGKPSLYHACATMFSSSNYTNNANDTVGANGVGMTLANYTSSNFLILNCNSKNVKGYHFTDGYLDGDRESDDIPEDIKNLPSGDFVENPLSLKEAKDRFDPFFDNGFLIDVTWAPAPNKLFKDKADIKWLIHYAEARAGELKSGEIEIHTFEDHEFTKPINTYIWNKDKESEHYVKSWLEKVREYNAVLVKDGPWTFAFNTDENMKVDSICQGALVNFDYTTNCTIQIQDLNIRLTVPFSVRYVSDEYPPYTDQTKIALKNPKAAINKAFERSDYVYKKFYLDAEKAYMNHSIKDSDASMYWPCLGDTENAELIIAEGYSAISGIKAQRNPETQACIALRGKISNTWNLDMVKAMKSDIIKQILNAILHNKFKRIIIATDADDDGFHISSLLIALLYRFTDVIEEGRLYFVHTPHYIFKKGKNISYSDDANDCPVGYHTTTCKGLGSLTPAQANLFITNPETRSLQKIVVSNDSNKDFEALDHAFSYGGEKWIA